MSGIRRVSTAAAGLLLWLLAAAGAAEPLSREEALALLATYDEAYATGDVDDLSRLVEEDALFSTTLWFDGEMEQVIVNRKRYFKAAQIQWRSGPPQRPRRQVVDISFSPDGREVTIVSEVVVARDAGGRLLQQKNRDVFHFVDDGKRFRLRRHDAESRL
jgi:hypothetical protein